MLSFVFRRRTKVIHALLYYSCHVFRSLINRDSLIHSDEKLFNEEANDERIFTFEWKFIFDLFKKKKQRQKSSKILENVASQKRHALLPELRTYIGYLWLLFPLFLKPKQMFKPRILRQWSNSCPFSYCNPQDTCRNENPGYENIFSEYIIHSNVSIQSESNFIHPWSRRVRKMTVLREQTLFLSKKKSLTFVARSTAVLLSQRKRRLFLFLITQNL